MNWIRNKFYEPGKPGFFTMFKNMPNNKPTIKAVIYDMDGLLLDTEIFYTEITQMIAGRYGKTFDWSVKSQMIGRPAIDSATALIQALQLPITPEQYIEEKEQYLEDRFPNAKAKPGAQELVHRLAIANIPQAVATSSSKTLFDLKTRHHNWFKQFDCIVTGDDPKIKQGKPAPDIFLLAAERLSVTPEQCLVFEDAPSGLQAGLAAGMCVVVIPEAEMDRSQYQGHAEMLSSLNEFDPVAWGLLN